MCARLFILFGRIGAGTALLIASTAAASGQNPFAVSASLERQPAGDRVLSVSFTVPAQHDLYADSIHVSAPTGVTLIPVQIPVPVNKHDEFTDTDHDVFTHDVRFIYRISGSASAPLEISVGYQGCGPTDCFLPATDYFVLSGVTTSSAGAVFQSEAGPARDDWKKQMPGFTLAGRQAGYMGPNAFLRFLDEAESGAGPSDGLLRKLFSKNRLWAWLAVALIIFGGFGLNLTPCVLPMIPVTIAILGAGTRSGSRVRGLALGAVYGGAMALAYGILGLGVVITGAKFGMLNSSPVFNAIVAVIFLILALAMFGVFFLDFSRFQRNSPELHLQGHPFLLAFGMGAVAALLAGSCVAPILLSVLLLSADMFKHGELLGLVLPFLLGLGMGLPWPFLGAGLSFLPPPGRWMINVKRVFGVIILGFAFYYGHLAYRLFMDRAPQSQTQSADGQQAGLDNGWKTSLADALAEAQAQQRPVFIDFWASWCKNCLAMDKTTFRDPQVLHRLAPYVKVKFRADQLDDPHVRSALDTFGSIGLPTYIVLQPAGASPD